MECVVLTSSALRSGEGFKVIKVDKEGIMVALDDGEPEPMFPCC